MKKPIPAPAGETAPEAAGDGTSRRQFLQVGGAAAASAAMIVATPKVASLTADRHAAGAATGRAVETRPSGPAPAEPVTAFVRDAERGEVTVMSGHTETTYKDPVLAKRLLDAARSDS